MQDRVAKDSFSKEKVHDWRRKIFRFGIWNLIYRFWVRLNVDGWENIPAEGPLVLMGNHVGTLDPVVMISFYPDRDIVPLAKIEAFTQPVLRYFVNHWGAIPVNRGEGDMRALKTALECIRSGYVVMLYAEGTRSGTGLIKGQEGSVYLALKTNATVVPVAIWGSRGFPKSWISEFARTDVFIRFGKPFRFRHEGKKLPRENFESMTDEAMYRIADLLPESLRGIYSDTESATTKHLDFNINWSPVRTKLPGRVTRYFRKTGQSA